MKHVDLFTDGACSGNPGPGGWGAILRYNGVEKELSGGEANTTNNRMELSAVIFGLKALKEPCAVTLYSDSQYLVRSRSTATRSMCATRSSWAGQKNGVPTAGCATKKTRRSTPSCGASCWIWSRSIR